MTTLRELHHLRGNPDFSHWNTVKLFSIAEASLLTAGLKPFLCLISSCIPPTAPPKKLLSQSDWVSDFRPVRLDLAN